jgi:hypothetical protein
VCVGAWVACMLASVRKGEAGEKREEGREVDVDRM